MFKKRDDLKYFVYYFFITLYVGRLASDICTLLKAELLYVYFTTFTEYVCACRYKIFHNAAMLVLKQLIIIHGM